jgi:carbamoyltransferase
MTISNKNLKVLGISAYYHDSAAALIVGDEIVAAAAEERFTRIKHDANFPQFAVAFCLRQAQLIPGDLDRIVYHEEPPVKFGRVLVSALAGFPRSRRAFAKGMQSWLKSRLWTRLQIATDLNVDVERVTCVPHHFSHMAQAAAVCPFDEAALLCVDAVGEWTCTSIGHQVAGKPLRSLESYDYPHSLGLTYAVLTAFLGFKPNDAEASTMALAAFGVPKFVEEIRKIIRLEEDGCYSINTSYFDFLAEGQTLFTSKLVTMLGEPRRFTQILPFDSLVDGATTPGDDMQRFADIAASIQRVLEDAMLGLARRARKLTKARYLCLAGGVALNAVANTRLIEQSGFEEVYCPTDPGDGGAAIGAALLGHRELTGRQIHPRVTPFLGEQQESTLAAELAAVLDPNDWRPYLADGCELPTDSVLEVDTVASEEALVANVVKLISKGTIVGWFQGRFEFGPRALGNRSILVDPANLESVRRLSTEVKKRASFRPYALSIREEDVAKVFDFAKRIPTAAHWMQMVKRVRPEVAYAVRGALHVNNSTRLQVCRAEHNPLFHKLLSAMAAQRGIGGLLNTSFNEPGYPIVATVADALVTFARTGLPVLVVGHTIIRKRERTSASPVKQSSAYYVEATH